RFRGGATLSMMYIPHDVDVIPTKIMHAIGTLQPGSVGIYGGYPSSTNQFVIKRRTNVRDLLARGYIPSELDEIDCELEIKEARSARASRGAAAVSRCIARGGGGSRDPIERGPGGGGRDAISGVVPLEHARERYGVAIDPATMTVDQPATERRRAEIREERR